MSTNPNLPAGFFITSINGIRCTAVPRSLTTLGPNVTVIPFSNAAAAAASTTTSSPPAPTTTSTNDETSSTENAQVQQTLSASNAKAHLDPPPPPPPPPSSDAGSQAPTTAAPAVVGAGGAAAVTNLPAAASSAPPAATALADLSGESSTTEDSVSSTTTSSARPASKGTTPTVQSQTAQPQIQTDENPTPTPLDNSSSGFQTLPAASGTPTNLPPPSPPNTQNSSPPPGVSASPRTSSAPVIGGVVGSVALMALVTVLFWLLRRRKRKGRNSSLTPTDYGNRSKFYEIDNGSVGPTKRTTKWKEAMGYRIERMRETAAELQASLKSKLNRDGGSTPSVNLNRGNSQFMDGPILQHSRNNSSMSESPGQPTTKDRLADFLQGMTERMGFGNNARSKDVRTPDPYIRGLTEKQALKNPPDFSQLLAMDERLDAQRRRSCTLSQSSIPQLGSLGLDFSSSSPNNPFADPPPKPNLSNPFSPISAPQPSIPKQSTYVTDIRRSRGQSVDIPNLAVNTNNNGPASRYPSTIATRDSYRDTVFSTAAFNSRKGKGRSDPFDLERPELLRQLAQDAPPPPKLNTASILGQPPPTATYPPTPLVTRGLQIGGARVQSVVKMSPRIVSGAPTYGSKYSSGASSFSGWGEPGPDLGAGSTGSGSGSLRGEVVSLVGSEDFDWSLVADGGGSSRRGDDGVDVSPLSVTSRSSFGGAVGKAM